jgi:hypothetical protein
VLFLWRDIQEELNMLLFLISSTILKHIVSHEDNCQNKN